MKKNIVRLPPDILSALRHFHPILKTKIRKGLDEIEANPHCGKPLQGRLKGLFSYRVAYYRIVYQINPEHAAIEVLDIEERRVVYKKIESLI